MSNTPRLDTLLSVNNVLDSEYDFLDEEISTKEVDTSPVIEIPVGEIDPRLKLLSYSSVTTLHECPRKFQLYKLQALENPLDDSIQSITFAFGHVVGKGIQDIMLDKSMEEVYLNAFLMWDADLLGEDVKAQKSFWWALEALQKFYHMRTNGYLSDYRVMMFESKPAVELGFIIEMENGFKYRGFADVVLEHIHNGNILVLETKTTKYRSVDSAMYKNSAQAIGYSVVLDKIVPGLSSYTVLYITYSSSAKEYIEMPFDKSFLQRALWLRNLLFEKHCIELYATGQDQFPQHGESCYNYFRPCSYLSLCDMTTSRLTKPLTEKQLERLIQEETKYQFRVTFQELVDAQLNKEI